jgi:hypothetical protein
MEMMICPKWKTCESAKNGDCKYRCKPHVKDSEYGGCNGHNLCSDCIPYVEPIPVCEGKEPVKSCLTCKHQPENSVQRCNNCTNYLHYPHWEPFTEPSPEPDGLAKNPYPEIRVEYDAFKEGSVAQKALDDAKIKELEAEIKILNNLLIHGAR